MVDLKHKVRAFLYLSLPGETSWNTFIEDANGDYNFTWANWNQSEKIEVTLRKGEEDLTWPALDNEAPDEEYYATKSEYLTLLSNCVSAIEKEGWGKVVVSRQQLIAKKINPLNLTKELTKAYPKACVYCWIHPNTGCWIGATPELLLEQKNQQIKTMSLAGTLRPNGPDTFKLKEEEEQDMVTEFVYNRLKAERGVSAVKRGDLKAMQAGDLQHLKTEITAKVNDDFNAQKLITKLHPTPAVAGFPQKETLAYLEKIEGYNRAYYTGYFGLEHKDIKRYYVNLRCINVFNNAFIAYAGGGITAQSVAEDEWLETEAKMEAILRIARR